MAEVRRPRRRAGRWSTALDLDGYHLLHATRADLLRRLGRDRDAAAAYDAAIELTANQAERAFLARPPGPPVRRTERAG